MLSYRYIYAATIAGQLLQLCATCIEIEEAAGHTVEAEVAEDEHTCQRCRYHTPRGALLARFAYENKLSEILFPLKGTKVDLDSTFDELTEP
jgi:hypothetical protein